MRHPTLVLVTTDDCHLCDHAHGVLSQLARQVQFELSEVDWETPEGQALVGSGGVPFPPALYMDGGLVAYGRLSERRLRALLAERAAR